MLEHTIRRVEGLVSERVLVVCGAHLLEATQEEIPWLKGENFLLEPAARNTGPAVALAAVMAHKRYGDRVVAVLPSDHYVRDEEGFREQLQNAADAAQSGCIVTLGIKPVRPETGYGYIRYAPLDMITDHAHRVAEFVEKPNFEDAVHYLESGDYVWNAGIFVFKPSAMLAEFERQRPDDFARLQRIADAADGPDAQAVLAEEFSQMESISVDYAIMENAEDVAVIPVSVGWSDVGHWAAVDSVLEADKAGNLIQGEVIAVDTRDSLLFDATDGVTAVVGLDGVVVVRTDDAVLVIPRHRAQDVRQVVDALRARGADFT